MLQTSKPGDVFTGTDFGLRRASTYERQLHFRARNVLCDAAFSYELALNLILPLKFVCLTNHTFKVSHSLSGSSSSKSKLRTSCGISFVISRRLMFFPMQVLEPIPN